MTAKTNPAKAKVKVLIVDDHPAVREGLALRIARQPDLAVCGEAADVSQALRMVSRENPDVAVIDIALKSGSGLDLVKRLKARGSTVRALIWSMYDEKMYAERALRAGAMGYITKEEATEQIVNAIRQVREGKVYLSPLMTDRLLQQAVSHADAPITMSPIEKLSDRELEVYRFIGQGLDTRGIAEKMHVSPKTVETYQGRIKRKLDLSSGRELIQHAVQWLASAGA